MIRIDLNKKLSNFQRGGKTKYVGETEQGGYTVGVNVDRGDRQRSKSFSLEPSGDVSYSRSVSNPQSSRTKVIDILDGKGTKTITRTRGGETTERTKTLGEKRAERLRNKYERKVNRVFTDPFPEVPNPNPGKFLYQFDKGGIYRAQDAEGQQGFSTEPQLKSSTGYVFPYEKYDMDASTQAGEFRNVETADNFTVNVAGTQVDMPIDRDEFGNVDYTTQYNELPPVVVKPEGSFVQYRIPTNRALLKKNKEYQDQQLYVEDDSTQSQQERLSNFVANNPNLTDKQKRIAQNKIAREKYLQYNKILGGADAWTDAERSGAAMGDGPDLENQERAEDPYYYSSLEGFRDDMADLTTTAVSLLMPMPGLNVATGIIGKGIGKAFQYASPYVRQGLNQLGKGIKSFSNTRAAPSLNFARNLRSGRNLIGTKPRAGYVDAFTMDGVKAIPKDKAVVFNRIEDANVTSAAMDKAAYETGNWFESVPRYFYNSKVKKAGTFGDDMQFLNPRDNRRLITGYMDPDAASAFGVGRSTSTARGMSGGQGLPVVETEMVVPPHLTNMMRDQGKGRFFKSTIGSDTKVWDVLDNTFTNRPRIKQGGGMVENSAQSFSAGGRIKLDLEKRLGVDIDKLDPLPIATSPKSRKFFQENPLAAIAYGTNPFRTAGSTRNMG